MNQEPVQEPEQSDPEADTPADQPDDDRALAGSAGDDVSGAMSVSGLGGEALRTEEPEAGLEPVDEQGEKLGWGKDEREQTNRRGSSGR